MTPVGRGSFIRNTGYHFVYQLWDGKGNCLYVGCTKQLTKRLAVHAKQHWFEDVARVEAKRYLGREWALEEEASLIATHQPLHNKQGTERYNLTLGANA